MKKKFILGWTIYFKNWVLVRCKSENVRWLTLSSFVLGHHIMDFTLTVKTIKESDFFSADQSEGFMGYRITCSNHYSAQMVKLHNLPAGANRIILSVQPDTDSLAQTSFCRNILNSKSRVPDVFKMFSSLDTI